MVDNGVERLRLLNPYGCRVTHLAKFTSIPLGIQPMSTDVYGVSGMAGGYAMGFSLLVKAVVQ